MGGDYLVLLLFLNDALLPPLTSLDVENMCNLSGGI